MKTLNLLLYLFVGQAMMASSDSTLAWKSAVIEFYEFHDSTPTTLSIRTSAGEVHALTVHWRGDSISIPMDALTGFEACRIDTLKVRAGSFPDDVRGGDSYLIVEFEFGEPSFGDFPSVSFLLSKGRYVERCVTRKTSSTEWSETIKPSGGEEVPAGKITEVGKINN